MIWDITWGIILALIIISVGLLAIAVFFAYWRQILGTILSLIVFGVVWHYIGLKWTVGIAGGLGIFALLPHVVERIQKSGKETVGLKRKQLGYDE